MEDETRHGSDLHPPTDDEGNPEWSVAGWMDLQGNYHDIEGGFVNVASLNNDEIYSGMDLVTISWVDTEDGTTQYARLEGPWEDFDDLENQVETYFQEGTP